MEVFEDKWVYGIGGVVDEGAQLASNFLEQVSNLGEPSNRIIGKIWSFVPTEGGGPPIPNFDSIFPRVFLLQYGRGSPVPTNKITKNHIKNHQSPKKCDFSMKK